MNILSSVLMCSAPDTKHFSPKWRHLEQETPENAQDVEEMSTSLSERSRGHLPEAVTISANLGDREAHE
jgi:hypothetical protein